MKLAEKILGKQKVSEAKDVRALEKDAKAVLKKIADLTNEFSDIRFEISDLADAGDKKAKDVYEGWTRLTHNGLSQALEEADIYL